MVTITELSADRSHEWLIPALTVYVRAMDYPVGTERHRAPLWREHLARPGWQAWAAYDDERLVGVIYGYPGAPDQWWNRQLRQGLRSAGVDHAQIEILARDYFELTELHIDPAYQGAGLGARLLETLLADHPHERVLLSTPETPGEGNRAWRLYRRYGFTDVLRHFRFLGDPRPFAVLERVGI